MSSLKGLSGWLVVAVMLWAPVLAANDASGQESTVYEFGDAKAMEAFRLDGPFRIHEGPGGGLEAYGAHTRSVAVSRDWFAGPIRATFEVSTGPGNVRDVYLGVCGAREFTGLFFGWGGWSNQETAITCFRPMERLPKHQRILPQQKYTIVLAIDGERQATITVDGKTIAERTVPASAKLAGPIVLSGGIGNVIYHRVTVDAEKMDPPPPTAKTLPADDGQVAAQADATASAPAGESPPTVETFNKSLQQYNQYVTGMDQVLAKARAEIPAFAKFRDVAVNKVAPLMRREREADRWLGEARERGEYDPKQNNYDQEKALAVIWPIAASVYKDVYFDYLAGLWSEQLELTISQEKIYLRVACMQFSGVTVPLPEPFEQHNPYDRGTPEYYLFDRDLGQAVTVCGSPLGKMTLPPRFEQAMEKMEQLRKQLVQQKKDLKLDTPVPGPYEDSYFKELQEALRKAVEGTGPPDS